MSSSDYIWNPRRSSSGIDFAKNNFGCFMTACHKCPPDNSNLDSKNYLGIVRLLLRNGFARDLALTIARECGEIKLIRMLEKFLIP